MNHMLWRLPSWLHDAIFHVTGYRLVMTRHYDQFGPYGYTYTWSKRYPL